ncbi:AraC family transcriptional regulator ligand-binding domain-containing protein [Thalassotalea fonticola]|uniref:AraC family transcriptional regulator ligand-binding domain-containing protein n=1 Tax=Thalassotalea fonticola TaxID=3065649 RepID=A0ABZ0GTJ8_9GAMM|nr:AraC family transcriptional regulator ligand-binding domain-containing protein [Colwelliaceae bacterium S1-1]
MDTITNTYFSSVLEYLEKNGIDRNTALSAIQFERHDEVNFRDKNNRVPLTQYNALLHFAKASLSEPLFGFFLGQDIRTADYGLLGYLVESSENLTTAINALIQYDTLVADIGKVKFCKNHKFAEITWIPNHSCNEQVVLRNMTAWVAVIRQLIGAHLSPTKVCFSHHWKAEQEEILAAWFHCPVTGNCKTNRIQFPLNYLTQPFRTENSNIHQMLKQESEQQLDQLREQEKFFDKVNQFLMAKTDLQECDIKNTAASFHLSTRTLQRRLKEDQVYFSQLLDLERQRRLKLYLGKMSLGQISTELGFNEQSSFNRAFYRWYQCTPLNYLKASLAYNG